MKTYIPRFAPYMSTPEIVWHYVLRSANVMVLLFLILPILAIIPLSFNENSFLVYPIHQFSFRWYHNLFTAVEWTRAGVNSFIVTPIATVLATVLGTLAALGLNKASFKGKGVLVAILISPMIVPVIVTGVGMYLQFARWGLSGTYAGLIFGHTVIAAPFVVVTVNATLAGFNHNYVRASLSLGASPVRVFMQVKLPIIAPGVVSGALFAFATSFDEIVVALFLTGTDQRTVPRQMWSGIREQLSPTILAVATVLVVISTLLLITLELLRRRSERLRGAAAA